MIYSLKRVNSLYRKEKDMSVNYYNKDTGELVPISGGLLFADTPVGTIQAYGSNTIPSGWLLCNGQAVSRTTYAELFEVIGTAFGVGDGSTTFNIPDLRGEFLRGAGTNSHSGQGNGGTVGQHQDATEVPYTEGAYVNSNDQWFFSRFRRYSVGAVKNADKILNATDVTSIGVATTRDDFDLNGVYATTIRPTNTSVNYIIKAKQVGVPTDIESNINAAINDLNTYTQRYVNVVRAFITETQTISLTSTFTGLLKVYAHKTGSGNTIHLKVNGREIDQFSCFSTDSTGTDLPWITTGNGLDVVLSAYVKKGDSVLIDSDQATTLSTNCWYVYSYIIQYNPSAQ